MKALITTAALAIALAAPAAQARTVKHPAGSHAATSVKAKTASKKVHKSKHKKAAKKGHKKAA